MVTSVIGYLRVFKDAGLSTATVQREGITHAQVSNLFWINVAVSGATANPGLVDGLLGVMLRNQNTGPTQKN